MKRERRVRVRSGVRDLDRFPHDDERLADCLMSYATEFLDKGLPRPALLALKSAQVIQYDLAGLVEPGQSLMGPMLAAVAGQEGVECVALVGTLRMRRKKGQPGLPSIAVYIEWPDNRWVQDRKHECLVAIQFVWTSVRFKPSMTWPKREGGPAGPGRKPQILSIIIHHSASAFFQWAQPWLNPCLG